MVALGQELGASDDDEDEDDASSSGDEDDSDAGGASEGSEGSDDGGDAGGGGRFRLSAKRRGAAAPAELAGEGAGCDELGDAAERLAQRLG